MLLLRSVALLALAAAALSSASPRPVLAEGAARRPHIVYIVADDQGWKDVGYHGSDIRTPSIDALAQGGMRLEQFYSQAFCTQSRAALMTGRYPFRYGLQTVVIPSAGRYGLPTDEVLLPNLLQQAGYRTVITGKWHLGHAERMYWPKQRGFDSQYGALLGEIDYFTHSAHEFRDWFRDNEPVKEEGYVTELIGNEAVRQIEAHDASKPLFLYAAFTAPHAPYQAPQAYIDAYKHIPDLNRRTYAAMITCLDDQVGRIVAALDKKGLRKDTLIVYQSDNGGPRSAKVTGEADMSKGAIPCDNGPYRDGKGSLYEGGNRVIALANWPGQVKAGGVADTPVHMVDMLPTLAGLAGAPLTGTKPLDGLDVWATLSTGAPSPRTEVVYNIGPFLAGLRQGDWKLVWRTTLPSQVELFNLATDPYEKTDLAAKEPAKVAELQRRVEALAREGRPPLLMVEAGGWLKEAAFGRVATPEDAEDLARQP